MDKKQIEEMIDLAIKQLDYSYVPYSHFHVERHFWQRMEGIIQGATLKMQLILQQTARKEPLFLRQSAKG